MQWLQSAFSSLSSPKSSSSSPSSSSPTKRDISLFFKKTNHHHRDPQPRLTRAKKVRHIRDIDVGRLPLTNFLRLSDNNNICASSSEVEFSSSRSSPAQPQPLPLPESSVLFRDTAWNASHLRRFPLPSPKEVCSSRPPSEERGDEIGGDAGSCLGIGRYVFLDYMVNFTYQTIHKITEQVDTLSTKSPSDRGKKVCRDRTGFRNDESCFRINASAMSAPGSGLSSPTLSPRRLSIGEFSPSPHGAHRGYVWSAPEMAATDMFTSPLWPSPDGPVLNPKNPSGSPMHPNMSPESSASRHESNGPGLTPKNPSGSPMHPKNSPESSASQHQNNGPGLNPKSPSGSPLHPKMSPETCAPRHESNGPSLNPKNSSGSPLHPKMSPGGSASRHESEGQASVHPLPRPPGSSVSSQMVLAHQTLIKAEVSPMTSQWKKGKLIGRGTFGSVYVATNRETGALCAMKEVDLIPDDPKSSECIQQLEQEIKVLSQLKHPNIVQYYGSEIVGDRFYIYLEYVHPGSINKYVRDHCGAITESVVRSFTRHILSGLAYLHSTKTIHRDIKGANLLVNASGVVKLADFGMAKHLLYSYMFMGYTGTEPGFRVRGGKILLSHFGTSSSSKFGNLISVQLSGQAAELSMKGSPYWMAPELIHAVNQKDTNGDFAFAVDIWSLGCTIIEIVNGKPPWSEFEGAAAMFKVWKETPPIPEILSPSGKAFLQCCFTRNPAERPSASMLLEHPFLKNSNHTEVQVCAHTFSVMKRGDAPHSPREWIAYKVDSMPISSRTHTTKRNMFVNGHDSRSGFIQDYCFLSSESAQQSHPTTCDSAAACLHSPRSTLEALPGLSPPHYNRARTSKTSSEGINDTHVGMWGSNACTVQALTQKGAHYKVVHELQRLRM
ncbi:hypothetical protein IFM89_032097 [Coptis chinensis]|uniref:mitogen-activated protein kinase kinase kinase n=1 Tax=Coptis chinensis TaxID=261450 RepID=A0A835I8V2_9MAGN|nr:hypothetical protein IFM89_032097 [Coptis chinensis]